MKVLRILSVPALTLALALSASAAQKSVTVYSDSMLNGQKIAAGDYKVDYEINGSTAQVKFLKNNKTVASSAGQVVEEENPAPQTAVTRTQNPDGTSAIVELQFAKQKTAIRFAPDASDKGK